MSLVSQRWGQPFLVRAWQVLERGTCNGIHSIRHPLPVWDLFKMRKCSAPRVVWSNEGGRPMPTTRLRHAAELELEHGCDVASAFPKERQSLYANRIVACSRGRHPMVLSHGDGMAAVTAPSTTMAVERMDFAALLLCFQGCCIVQGSWSACWRLLGTIREL